VDHEGLAVLQRQPLAQQPRHDVDRTAGGKTVDQPHRPHRIVERRRLARQCRRQRRARGQMRGQAQKFSARQIHSALILANVLTLAHLSVSSAMNLPNSFGVIGAGTPPRSPSLVLNALSARTALIALWRFWTM